MRSMRSSWISAFWTLTRVEEALWLYLVETLDQTLRVRLEFATTRFLQVLSLYLILLTRWSSGASARFLTLQALKTGGLVQILDMFNGSRVKVCHGTCLLRILLKGSQHGRATENCLALLLQLRRLIDVLRFICHSLQIKVILTITNTITLRLLDVARSYSRWLTTTQEAVFFC